MVGTKPSRHRSRSRSLRSLTLIAVLIGIGAPVLGCGSDEANDGDGEAVTVASDSPPDCPSPSNRSLRALLEPLRQGPILAPGVSLIVPGKNRFSFALFDHSRRQIGGLQACLYVSKGLDETAHGPAAVRYEPIELEPRFRSKTTAEDDDAAQAIYTANARFDKPGTYLVTAFVKLGSGNQLVATSPAQVTVTAPGTTPGPGDRAPVVHTPTKASVDGDLSKIDTRVPPSTMHDVDLADALDRHRPVILLFSTPALCVSRVCGPVTDVAEQVKSEYGDSADFIHMEIYNENDPTKGVRSQVRKYGLCWDRGGDLCHEPFLFAIDSNGRIVERIEGAFSARELEGVVREAIAGRTPR
jgi:hypothetical protein